MVKKMLVLALAMVFGISGTSFAGAVELSDSAMDGVSAGDWVILTDGSGNQTVEDVYHVNNTLWLLENSQKDIQAVSNANTVDSAIAVQTNIARVSSGNPPSENVAVNGSNDANITNYRPASSSNSKFTLNSGSTKSASSKSGSKSDSAFALNLSETKNFAASSSSSSSKQFDYDEELDITGSAAGSSKEIGKNGISGGSFAASLVVDYDKEISATKTSASASAASATKTKTLGISKTSSSSSFEKKEFEASKFKTIEKEHSSRDSKGANNHILLDATSQQNIKVVSNLNSVASGAAVQNNIASNVGVSGSITHANSATVQNGF